jgi:hypothetical protein
VSTRLIDANTTNTVKPAHFRVESKCVVCRRPIKSGDGRYRIVGTEYHPECFTFWLTAPLTRDDRTTK